MTMKQYNLEKIKEINKFECNWNSYDAKKFDKKYLDYIKDILNIIDEEFQPEIFPLANGYVQFEWNINDLYIEIEIYDNYEISIYYEIEDNKDSLENGINLKLNNKQELIYILKLILYKGRD